eukprot:GEMP01089766.1.p1 GENE.GEMP01089766.1~~GEMP01089766.1.p1  ORF type:complete len:279 (+),score=43.56 GEMP01089766.1:45-839(+)
MPRLATSPRHSDKSTARSVLARPVARARLKFVDSTPNLVDECLICYESTARRIPCCTARVCQRCAKGLSKCPICRVALLDEDIELCFEVASEGELRTRIREAVHLSALALICLRGRSPQEVEFFQDLLLYKALRIIRTLPLESFAFESERLVELIEQHNFDRNLAIYANQFNPGLPPDVSAVTLEFTLKQPSPMWVDKDFSIRSLQGYVFHRTSTECGCSTPDEEEETFVSLVRRYRLGVEGFVADKPRGIADYCELSEVALEM